MSKEEKPTATDAARVFSSGDVEMSAADREAMASKIKETLESMAKTNVLEYLEGLPSAVKPRVEALLELQKEHDDLESKFLEEKAALEAKYQKLYDPLYVKRSDIVNGVTEVTGEDKSASTDDVKGVPDFWLTALKNNEVVQEQITERDEGALKYLKDIKWANLPEGKGFKLDFYFTENPYFKNSVLTKTYFMIDEEEPILEKAEGTTIQWEASKNLTQKILRKKPKPGAKNSKPIIKTEECESFFNFFSPPQVPSDDEEIEEEEAEALQEAMEADYEIGSILKEKIIPHAVSWFTGEAGDDELDYDDEEGDEEEDENEGEDEEEDDDEEGDDDEDDDDDEGDKLIAKQARKPKKPSKKGGEQEQPQECKQQ